MKDKMIKIYEKLDVSKETADKIMLEHHILNNIYTEKQLKHLEIELDTSEYKYYEKIAKTLKVDIDAVFSHYIQEMLANVTDEYCMGEQLEAEEMGLV